MVVYMSSLSAAFCKLSLWCSGYHVSLTHSRSLVQFQAETVCFLLHTVIHQQFACKHSLAINYIFRQDYVAVMICVHKCTTWYPMKSQQGVKDPPYSQDSFEVQEHSELTSSLIRFVFRTLAVMMNYEIKVIHLPAHSVFISELLGVKFPPKILRSP